MIDQASVVEDFVCSGRAFLLLGNIRGGERDCLLVGGRGRLGMGLESPSQPMISNAKRQISALFFHQFSQVEK